MKQFFLILIVCSITLFGCGNSKSITEEGIQNSYSGKIEWNSKTGILKFLTSGEINFKEQDKKSFIWYVPKNVRQIIIAKNCKVNGAFFLSFATQF